MAVEPTGGEPNEHGMLYCAPCGRLATPFVLGLVCQRMDAMFCEYRIWKVVQARDEGGKE